MTACMRVLLAVCFAAAVCHPRSAFAQTGANMTSTGNGLSLTLITQWLDGGGYRPLRIEIVPAVVPVADRTVHVEFTGKSWAFRSREILVTEDIEVPAGSTKVEATLSVPQHFPWQQYHLEVWIDGRYSKTLSQRNIGMVGGVWNGWHEGMPNVLVIADASTAAGGKIVPSGIIAADPGSGELARLLPENANVQAGYRTATTIAQPANTATPAIPLYTLMAVPLDLLPQRWIDYTSLDLVCISIGQIEQLAAQQPSRWQAIRDWTAAGGNLIVSGAGANFENLGRLDRWLSERSLGSGTPEGSDAATAPNQPGDWQKPSSSDDLDRLKDAPAQPSYGNVTSFPGAAMPAAPSGAAPTSPAAAEPPPTNPASFRLRPFDIGMVVATTSDDVFKEPMRHWAWILNSLTADRWLWYRRHGLSYERGNPNFWDWLIAGVGLAPVSEFRILISVFVLAIGPLNYYWLRRRGKLHLLVLIVPLAALAVTSSLFGYALIADGLDVRVRSRSFTQIDQRAGRAVCWARNSYYAGLAPSSLNFPADMAVFPLAINENDESDAPYRHSLMWTDHEQRLVSGWLASRTPTQFITVRARPSLAGIKFGRTGEGPQVENRLGTRIARLLLADGSGQHYRAADVADGARVKLQSVEPGDEEIEIWRAVMDLKPGVPMGFTPHSDYGFGIRRRGGWYYGQNANLPAPSQDASRLEAALRTAIAGPGGRSVHLKPIGFPLAPRSYLALVDRSPEVDFGIDDAREENSLHVVVGNW